MIQKELNRRLIECGVSRKNLRGIQAAKMRNLLSDYMIDGGCILIINTEDDIVAYFYKDTPASLKSILS